MEPISKCRLESMHEMVEPRKNMLSGAFIEGVLGQYSHRFSIDETDDFTILYGVNGVGKTRFLESIDALIRFDLIKLRRLPFEKLTLYFRDDSVLWASKSLQLIDEKSSENEEEEITREQIEIGLQRVGETPVITALTDDELIPLHPKVMARYRKIGPEIWEDKAGGEILTEDELRARYDGHVVSYTTFPDKLREFAGTISCTLIETQRLHSADLDDEIVGLRRLRARRTRPKIDAQADRIRRLLNEAQTDHSRLAQRLDRSFPNRILQSEEKRDLNETEIRKLYAEQNTFRERIAELASVSFGDDLALPKRSLEGWELSLLNMYLEDTIEKLRPFEDILKKVQLLEEIINKRLTGKILKVNDEFGLLVERERDGQRLELEALSSGEQHEIILMNELLFGVEPGSVVLIDEPEISLHIGWQLSFIGDVQLISGLVGFNFVVATHSPQIINDRWGRAVELHAGDFT